MLLRSRILLSFFLALFLASEASAQIITQPGFTGGTISSPLLGTPNECTTVPYAFTGWTTSGLGHATLSDSTYICTGGVRKMGFTGIQNVMDQQVLLVAGSAATPSITFSGSATTGFFLPSANTIGFGTLGVQRATLSTSSFTSTLPFLAADGTVSAPSYSFSGLPESGLWRTGNTIVLQNFDLTPDASGRARLTLGSENFTLNAVRSENAAHSGNIQCFDEGGAVPICRMDSFDGTNTGTFRTLSTFADFNIPLRLPAGTAAAPAYAFTGNTDVGIYDMGGSNGLGVAVDGIQVGRFNQNGVLAVCPTCRIGGLAGSAAAPFFIFTSFSTGLYETGVGNIGISVGGAAKAQFATNGIQTISGAVGSPPYSFIFDSTTGIYQPAGSSMGFTAGSELQLTISGNGVDFADSGAKPVCSSAIRGLVWFDEGGAGVADTFEICAKSSADAYAWYAMATIP